MYNEQNSKKHCSPALRRRRARRRKRLELVLAVILVACFIVSGVTLAYLFTGTESVENTFKSARVACEVIENGTDGSGGFDGVEKTNVRIRNTGDVQSYIRAKVVVTWMSEDKKTVTASQPACGTDYAIEYVTDTNESTNWVLGADGYWYYTVPVNPDVNGDDVVDEGTETGILITSCKLNEGVTAPEGFYLSVEIIASSIQSVPTSVVAEQWSSGVSSVSTDGSLMIKE